MSMDNLLTVARQWLEARDPFLTTLAELLRRNLLKLPDSAQRRDYHQFGDVEIQPLLQGYLRPRLQAVAVYWERAVVQNAPPELLALLQRLCAQTWDEYRAVRLTLISTTQRDAAGHMLATPVQRTFFYGLFVITVGLEAIVGRLREARRDQDPLHEYGATEFSAVVTLGAVLGRNLAVRLDTPLRQYTLGHVHTALTLFMDALHDAGIPSAVRADDVSRYWQALWTRLAQIFLGDLTAEERASRTFFDVQGGVEGVTQHQDVVVDERLACPLPIATEHQRLRLAALARFEVTYFVHTERLRAFAVFERASLRPEAVALATALKQRLRAALGARTAADLVLAVLLRTVEQTAGATGRTYVLETFSRLMPAVFLQPGSNESFAYRKIEQNRDTPPLYEAPDAGEVVFTVHRTAYAILSSFHRGSPIERLQARWFQPPWLAHGQAATATPPPRPFTVQVPAQPHDAMDGYALAYVSIVLDGELLSLERPSHVLWTTATYLDELEQHRTTAAVLPPASPDEAFARYGTLPFKDPTAAEPVALNVALVRFMKHHFFVVRVAQQLVTLDLGLNVCEAILVWFAAAHPAIFPATGAKPGLPREFLDVVRQLRGGGGGGPG